MNNDLISVVIPTFNRGKIITKSIKSVLNQTLKNIEVIVVDDGSTDNTASVVKKIKDKRLRYYKLKNNKGACYARNYGILKSKGKYIAFQDSDDVFHTDKLEKQLENLVLNNSDLDFCRICLKFIDDCLVPTDSQIERFNVDGYVMELCRGNFISTQAILVKKEIFDEISFDESFPRFQDYDLVLRIAKKYKISYTNYVLVDLYKEDNNSIGSSDEKLKKACLCMIRKDYGLNSNQEDVLFRNLLFWASKKENDELSDKYFSIISEHQILVERFENSEVTIAELKKNIGEMKDTIEKLNVEKKQLSDDYQNLLKMYDDIIHSKRFFWMNKIMKIFGK